MIGFKKSVTHAQGSNNRTICGWKISPKMPLVEPQSHIYLATCKNCLARIAQDSNYMLEILKWLQTSNIVLKAVEK